MEVESYSHVMHIVSNVTGTLAPGCDAFDALRATFPAGTVSRRAEDPRDGDHPRAGTLCARAVRRHGRLRRRRRRDGHVHHDPHVRDRRTGGRTCSRAPASSPTPIPSASTRRRCTRRGRCIARSSSPRAMQRSRGGGGVILVVDNYDSFTYNLVQLLAALGAEVRVERNDAVTAAQVAGDGAQRRRHLARPGDARGRGRERRGHRRLRRAPASPCSASVSGIRRSPRCSAAASCGRRRRCTARPPTCSTTDAGSSPACPGRSRRPATTRWSSSADTRARRASR